MEAGAMQYLEEIRGMQSTDAAMVLHQRTVIGQKRLRFSNLVLR